MFLHLILLTQCEQEVRRSFESAVRDVVYLGRRFILSYIRLVKLRNLVVVLGP